jgi:hypothetical protein
MSGIQHLKQLLALKCSSSQDNHEEINQRMEQVVVEATRKFAANQSSGVNNVFVSFVN